MRVVLLVMWLCVSSQYLSPECSAAEPIRVLVWDEQQPAQKAAYANFLGNEIAAYLSKKSDLKISTSRLDDPARGISEEQINGHDILVWWGHVRHREIPVEVGQRIVKQIQSGKLSLVALQIGRAHV